MRKLTLIITTVLLTMISIATANQITTIQPIQEIKVKSQTGIDKYFHYEFQKINDTTWKANITFDPDFIKDAKNAMPNDCTNQKWSNLVADYNLTENANTVCQNIKNITNYPVKKTTTGWNITGFTANLAQGTAELNINFPQGFSPNEEASLGFGTTNITTGGNQGWYSFQRALCRDGAGNLHLGFRYNTTLIKYAKSTDNGNTWIVNDTFASGPTYNEPYTTCTGNKVAIIWANGTSAGLTMMTSTNNGVAWTKRTPVTTLVRNWGQAIYTPNNLFIFWLNTTYDIEMMNSSNDGATWSAKRGVVLGGGNFELYFSTLLSGSGDANTKIGMVFRDDNDDDIYFTNSTNAGTSWSGKIKILTTTSYYPSIAQNFTNTTYYTAYDTQSGDILYNKSANSGQTWNSGGGTVVSASTTFSPTITIDQSGHPWIFYVTNTYQTNNDIAWIEYNGTAWEQPRYVTMTPYTQTPLTNNYVNAKQDYNNNKIEIVWRRGNVTGPWQIFYTYIDMTTAPNIIGVPSFMANASRANPPNCSAIYNGNNSGTIEFTFYVNGILNTTLTVNATALKDKDRAYGIANNYSAYKIGDNITCSARAYNTTTWSANVNSTTIQILNAPPQSATQPTFKNYTQKYSITSTVTELDGLTDIANCTIFYKLDENKTLGDTNAFLSTFSIPGTYNNAIGTCTANITLNQSGQLRYMESPQQQNTYETSSTYYLGKKIMTSTNYIFTINETTAGQSQGISIYNKTNGNYITSINLTINPTICENNDFIFTTTATDVVKINKTSLTNTSINTSVSYQSAACTADDDFVYINNKNGPTVYKYNITSGSLEQNPNVGPTQGTAIYVDKINKLLYHAGQSNVQKINTTNMSEQYWGNSYTWGVYGLNKITLLGTPYIIFAQQNGWIMSILDNGTINQSMNYTPQSFRAIENDSDILYLSSKTRKELSV